MALDARELDERVVVAILDGSPTTPEEMRRLLDAATTAGEDAAANAPAAVRGPFEVLADRQRRRSEIVARHDDDVVAAAGDGEFVTLTADPSQADADAAVDGFLAAACDVEARPPVTTTTTTPANPETSVPTTAVPVRPESVPLETVPLETVPPETIPLETVPPETVPVPPPVPVETAAPETAPPVTVSSVVIDDLIAALLRTVGATPEQHLCVKEGLLALFGPNRLVEMAASSSSTPEEDASAEAVLNGCGVAGALTAG